jgi:hypothetical protein
MPTNTYSDGFPLTPLESIEFSYFLSEAEKQEWREWLQSATIEQQNELVDILHSMWQDNQKQAVPAAFTTQQPVELPQTFIAPQPEVSTVPDTSFTNEMPPVPAIPQFVEQKPETSPLDNTFASASQFQFVDETEPAVATPQLTTPTAEIPPSAVVILPVPVEPQNIAVVDTPSIETKPQFEDNFQAPNLSQAQVQSNNLNTQQPRPIPAPQPPLPIINDEELEEEDDLEMEHPISQPIQQSEDENQEFALKKMASTKYSPNPILEDKTPPRDEFVYKNAGDSNQSKNTQKTEPPAQTQAPRQDRNRDQQNIEARDNRDSNRENRNQPRDNQSRDNRNEPRDNRNEQREIKTKQPITEERKQSFFGGSQLRESAAKNLLDDVYKAYQGSRTKTAQSSKDLDDKFVALLDRIMQVISNSDQLATYYETIIEKIIEVNDKVVDQAKEIQLLKNNTQSRGGLSLQDQVDEMRDDIERLNRDTRTMRIDQRRNNDEISSRLASFGADSFNQDRTGHIVDRLKSQIFQIQQKLNMDTDKPTTENTNFKGDYSNSPRPSQNPGQNRRPNSNNKDQ